MSRFIVQSAAACMPASCKYGPYRRVAVLEVEDGVSHVRMISARARGVKRVVRVWERLYVGSSDRCAFAKAYRAAQQRADELNRELANELQTLGVQS